MCYAQSFNEKAIDEGYGILKINEPLEKIRPSFIAVDSIKLWAFTEDLPIELFTAYGIINLKKSEPAFFPTLTVQRSEVYFHKSDVREYGKYVDTHFCMDLCNLFLNRKSAIKADSKHYKACLKYFFSS